jgi:hypothetical protein
MAQAETGDHGGAERTLRAVLELTLEAGTPRSRFEIAEIIAGTSRLASRHADAVRMGAAARAERRRLGQPRATGLPSWLDEHEPALRAVLGDEPCAHHVEAGAAASLSDLLRSFRDGT